MPEERKNTNTNKNKTVPDPENAKTEEYENEEEGEEEISDDEPVTVFELVEKNIAKRREARAKRRERLGVLPKIAIGLAVFATIFAVSFTDIFTVDTIEVEGNTYFTDEEITNMAHAETGINLWHSANTRMMKDYLEKSPYIVKAKVRRIIPGTIRIRIEERRQVGAVIFDSEYLVLDKDGLLLRRTETRPKITLISGIKIKEINVGEKLGVSDEKLLSNSLKIINAMEKGGVYFMEIEMTEMYIQAHVYESLICVGKTDQIIEAIDKGRLQQILKVLFEKGIKRGTITISDDGYASFKPTV